MVRFENKYIGKILEIKSNKLFEFYINNNIDLKIDDLVGIEVEQNIWLVAKVNHIKTNYYLKEPDLYFISKASKNSLDKINTDEIKYALVCVAENLGYYEKSNSSYEFLNRKTNLYTPKPLQDIFKLGFLDSAKIFGLNDYSNNFSFGEIAYPFEGHDAFVDKENFNNKHTLISGITGSGKTRLTSIIIEYLATINAHVWVIDPHLEYLDLLTDIKEKISIFSRKGISNKYQEFLEFTKKINGIEVENLFFSSKLINAYTLCNILPNISIYQEEIIHNVYNSISYNDVEETDLLEEFLNQIQNETFIKEDELNSIVIDKHFVKVWEVNKFVKSKNKNSDNLFLAYLGLQNRINQLQESGLFKKITPSWLEKKTGKVDILAEDYSADIEGVRFINTLLSQFLNGGTHPKFSTIIIDEAHQLFKIQNEKVLFNLNRLLREARKFNISMIFITQNKNDLPDDMLSQFSNFFSFREYSDNLNNLNNQSCRVSLANSKSDFVLNVKNNIRFSEAK